MTTPKPGSPEAIDAGCLCAVLDNNHGKYPPRPPDGWWINGACPLHGHPVDDPLVHDHPEDFARDDYALDRLDVAGPVPPTEARRRAAARREDGRPDEARYWDAYAEAGEAEAEAGEADA